MIFAICVFDFKSEVHGVATQLGAYFKENPFCKKCFPDLSQKLYGFIIMSAVSNWYFQNNSFSTASGEKAGMRGLKTIKSILSKKRRGAKTTYLCPFSV